MGLLAVKLIPGNSTLIGWLFLRALALVYLSAFLSLAVQIKGLVGAEGLLPAVDQLRHIQSVSGDESILHFPTLFWLNASDSVLVGACYLGACVAVLVFFDLFSRLGLIICFLLYLSAVNVGQTFMNFQWDTLLLETGFLAIFLTGGSRIVVFLFRWLLFRFMLMSGVVKLASGDPNWWNLTALKYHYETQPLPTPLAWYAHQFPLWFQKISVAGVLFIELVVPFMVFMPRRLRLFAACCFLLLQICILLTGNYNFFNLLVIILCLFLLEDRDIAPLMNLKISNRIMNRCASPGVYADAIAGGLAVSVFLSCIGMWWQTNFDKPLIQPLIGLVRVVSAVQIVNLYGPFAVMTTKRLEIDVEGAEKHGQWLAYEFKYKPGDVKKPLSWNIPHQPRLDWQMWFAALALPRVPYWLDRLQLKLLQGSPDVVALLKKNPFENSAPDRIRLSFYRYRFTRYSDDSASRGIWEREYLGSSQFIIGSIE